jgi:AbrB family looped-hinge helix DNA binding protein
MSAIAIQVSQGGRIVIPADIRQKMGINIGDEVLLTWQEGSHELRIATRKQRLQRARQLVQQHIKTKASLVDELMQERRQAAADE